MTDSEEYTPSLRLLREHPALIVSGLYAFATFIGMFYSWRYLRHFDINVFLYAEIGDFLLASFKSPAIWGVVVFMMFVWYYDYRSSLRWGTRERPRGLRWYGTSGYRRWSYPSATIAFLFMLNLYAVTEAEEARLGAVDRSEVKFAESEISRSLFVLDATARFVFLYNPDTHRVYVRPHESITEISFSLSDEDSPE